MALNSFQRYLLKKIKWYIATLFVAISLNFILPRLSSSGPIDTVLSKSKLRMTDEQYYVVEAYYSEKFDLDKPVLLQFILYVFKTIKFDLGESFVHERSVWSIFAEALPWTIALQFLSIISGFILGNILGTAAAYTRGVYDKLLYPLSIFLMSIPYFCLGIILVYYLGIKTQIFPAMGGYAFDLNPGYNIYFLYHFILLFLTLTLVIIGGQAIGMRSLAVQELGAENVQS